MMFKASGAREIVCVPLTAGGDKPLTCLGPRCAQWRWFDPPVCANPDAPENADRRGYCGLSHRPNDFTLIASGWEHQ